MNPQVNAIASRLSLRAPQRDRLRTRVPVDVLRADDGRGQDAPDDIVIPYDNEVTRTPR